MVLKKIACLIVLTLGFFAIGAQRVQPLIVEATSTPLSLEMDGNYASVLSAWLAETYPDNQAFQQIIPASWIQNGELLPPTEAFGKAAVAFQNNQVLQLEVNVPTEGLYQISLEYYSLSQNHLDLELEIKINHQWQYHEMRQLTLPKRWVQESTTFPKDRYGNDFFASQKQEEVWNLSMLMDPLGLYVEGLYFHLDAGVNTIQLEAKKGTFLIHQVLITGKKSLPTYQEYIGSNTASTQPIFVEIEAEIPTRKSDSTIQPGINRDLGVTPFEVRNLRMNVLQASTFQSPKQEVFYDIVVPQSGYYYLTFKVLQNIKTNGIVYRTVKINGEIPFEESKNIPFTFANQWQNKTLGDQSPYLYYLAQGVNTLSLQVSFEPYREMLLSFQSDLTWINETSLQIRKLTGNQLDKDRDWDLSEFLPNIDEDLLSMASRLEIHFQTLSEMHQSSRLSEVQSQLRIAIRNLRFLASDPNQIPKQIALLSSSPSSIAQTLGWVIADLSVAPLTIDKFYVHNTVALPEANASFFASLWLSIQRFFLSFFDSRYQLTASPEELEVWVNRPKLYVDLIQKMADETFTVETGIPVKISVLADEGKLILANSAKRNPDVALGISSWLPYDLGIRGALTPINQFSSEADFSTTLSLYPTQSLIPLVYNQTLYGLPDTENVYLLFYRRDILDTLDLEVPQTWEDVTRMMPVLRRFGMNFALPLSSATALKSFDSTLPFLFQYGSSVYRQDGFSVDLNNSASIQAITMMTELYTIYSLEQTVSNFYNDFRLGKAPIGVGDFGMYIRLLNAAPDIKGLWEIALIPGVRQSDDSIRRDAPGAQTANVIFQNTDKANEAWSFLSWWSSTSTQVQFANYLLASLGREYLWNSANLEAFRLSGYDEGHVVIFEEQWSHLRELPKVPGSYQVELEISNIWNSVVLNRANLRVRLNDSLIKMEKEIHKKMAEFGYMDKQGNILKPYVITTEALIIEWQTGGDDFE